MLSYRHAFHAGNFADVLKHSVLTLVLDYMTRKEKGFHYIDSHSGAGMYQLEDEYAQKTGEYKEGIAKLINESAIPESLQPYIDLIKSLNPSSTNTDVNDLTLYPGSPGIAKRFMRRQDSTHLFELHPTDIEHLNDFCYRWKKVFVKQSDGYQGVLGLVPPPSRRGVVLIDPPYELKEDYNKAVQTIIKAYTKFATGTYILWYPVVKRELVEQMSYTFSKSAVKNVLQVEFCLENDTDKYGMTGTGLFIVNPPWQLSEQLDEILPFMKSKLGTNNTSYTVKQLIPE
ncbi:23S rRNA (adenine(2030)-N(6))-methyltransferase RlmJ [Colwellia sp. 1_MG-2023]|uniref:23S rRNA (adenine(2030)-N(6))-methyltransferase RlmJ n=1 Tax=unclassified Colwellia TaxID=196834 RepID=UPI001C09A8DF|nr:MULTISPECIES: 23S rRNA (adenine(2030)-N(6))-methyltransferase RlmJ [unclassified Colwellia]MBU2926579.1 23S rRNA (adenine(2030)-N(6))-methyltransferase RlmJ [Colwellia sp. C2M11]MDO6489655.1 23S rRNA (adenine(2030)-N(6))-methyltransferase RlmJ [Colwellia sp. 6_MG-2023]MDO6652617.1 23S rRNA (adenine(2030)-N(6))-methyltransferase RlmJ [Colwellia sp. 3_MG-2023]MDO6665218.1 23S rRNA (adenine(2030)-N(6))-methyltransferase RlmJ [Colwellia sp. 2_MG-2023]MDO6689460.1 23S rRNA (adenine(2030)-N(6))-m